MVSRPRAALDREFASAQGNWQPYRHSVGSGNYGLLRMMLGNGEIMCNATQSEQYPLKFIVFLRKIYTHADSRCFPLALDRAQDTTVSILSVARENHSKGWHFNVEPAYRAPSTHCNN
ncbi:hypothetical protein BofuT4_P086440.1 [Botrytis cinerea T4]|uniref:Uncharacterized protein n=1 Tax=Botryotinia fuckeliana (strain T4) TaxID=999810 RepID=G2YGG7_BOTF4|nr:hypothetical protein BofuT4_P086440.1 [Botrytis cinerea T4]